MAAQKPPHRALDTLDVLAIIFKQIMTSHGSRSVANCAITCSAWKEAAFDELWRGPILIIHAIQILSSVTWVKDASRRTPDRYVFDGAPTPYNWIRFRLISRRIRVLVVGGDHEYGPRFDPSLVEQIRNAQLDGDLLFPNVTSLAWDGTWSSDLNEALPFMGPKFRTLSMTLHTRCPERFVRRCPITSPNITDINLSLSGNRQTIPSIDTLAQLVTGLPRLERLQMCRSWYMDLTPLIASAASHPKLHKLALSGDSSAWITAAPSSTEPLFAQLTDLDLSIQLGRESIALIESIAVHQLLRTFRFEMGRGGHTQLQVLPRLFQAIGLQKHITMIHLTLSDVPLVTSADLGCLSDCVLIQDLSVITSGYLSLNDEDLSGLVRKMVGLRTLNLQVQDAMSEILEGTFLTLAAFAILVTLCPAIDHIALPARVSTSCIPSLPWFQPSKTLSRIRIPSGGEIDIDDPKAVASFISQLSDATPFSVDAWVNPEDSIKNRMWGEVKGMIPGLQQVRLAASEDVGGVKEGHAEVGGSRRD